jgi:hypothetical protein
MSREGRFATGRNRLAWATSAHSPARHSPAVRTSPYRPHAPDPSAAQLSTSTGMRTPRATTLGHKSQARSHWVMPCSGFVPVPTGCTKPGGRHVSPVQGPSYRTGREPASAATLPTRAPHQALLRTNGSTRQAAGPFHTPPASWLQPTSVYATLRRCGWWVATTRTKAGSGTTSLSQTRLPTSRRRTTCRSAPASWSTCRSPVR